jgi:hypothetical protein
MTPDAVVVTLTWQEVVQASTVGLRRRIASMQQSFGERNGVARKGAAERWYYNIVGACGELAVAKAVNAYWPSAINQAKDEADVGHDIQVRCLAEPHYDLIVRKDDPDYFRYVLCVGEPPTLTLVGWVWGFEAKRPEWLYDRGERNEECYWVPQAALSQMWRLKP